MRVWTTFAWLVALIALCDGLNRVGFVRWFAYGIAGHLHDAHFAGPVTENSSAKKAKAAAEENEMWITHSHCTIPNSE